MTEPAAVVAEPGPANFNPPRELTLKFRGSAREYFRIWVVNLCLTLLTAGIFSAWAKVRKKRYFYSHVVLDGTPFQYLARPLPILKGRIIAAILFSIYYASSHFFIATFPYVLAAAAVIAPWVIVRSAAFNARYSAFRNMTFQFDGRYSDSLKVLYYWGLVPAVAVGSVYSWWGDYKIAGVVFLVFGLLFPWWIKNLKNFIVSRTAYGGEHGALAATGWQFFKVYFVAALILIGFSALGGVVMVTLLKGHEWAFIVGMLPVYAAYVLAFAYVQARTTNLVWNKTRLGPLRFESSLRGWRLAMLYVTNALAILASVGLLIPWAVIRTLKYRADHMRVLLEGELADFRGRSASAVQATGAELGEFFDVDLSL